MSDETCRMKAKHAYEARTETELSLTQGDVVDILDQSNGDWWLGRVGESSGYFPSSYVDPTPVAAEKKAKPPPPKKKPAPATAPAPAAKKGPPPKPGDKKAKPAPGGKKAAPPMPSEPCPYKGNAKTISLVKGFETLDEQGKMDAYLKVSKSTESKQKAKNGISQMMGMYAAGSAPHTEAQKQLDELSDELKELEVQKNALRAVLEADKSKDDLDEEISRLKKKEKQQKDAMLAQEGAIRTVIAHDAVEKAGWVHKKGTGMRGGWKSNYAVLKDGNFSLYHDESDFKHGKKADVVIPALTANVKPMQADKPFACHLVGIEHKLTLCTDSAIDTDEWVMVLQNATMAALGGVKSKLETKEEKTLNPLEAEVLTGAAVQPFQKEIEKVEGNDVCVDCFEQHPLWASINLGVLMCIECSGRHRHLGVHISKVRSFQLDNWDPEVLEYFKIMGNTKVNLVLEASANKARKYKPMDAALGAMRDDFIQKKYVKRTFFEQREEAATEQSVLDRELFELVKESVTPDKCVGLLLMGANPNSPMEGDLAPLHVAAEAGNTMLVLCLLLNGANVNMNSSSGTPLHIAAQNNHLDVAKILLRNGADIWKKSAARQTSIDLAEEGSELHTLLTTLSPTPPVLEFPKNGGAMSPATARALLDSMEIELLPLVRENADKKLPPFGAAVLKKSDLSVLACAPAGKGVLEHAPFLAVQAYHEVKGRPPPQQCVLITLVQPCCLCASAITMTRMSSVCFLWDIAEAQSLFELDHVKYCRELFGREAPISNNEICQSTCLLAVKGISTLATPMKDQIVECHNQSRF